MNNNKEKDFDMKKILFALILVLALLAPMFAMAAGSSFVVTSDTIYTADVGGDTLETSRAIVLTFTADASNASIPALTIGTNRAWTDGTLSGALKQPLTGWLCDYIHIDGNHAGTEPTENSDITVVSGGLDMLNAAGTDQVDNTDERDVVFSIAGYAVSAPVFGDIVVTISNNEVNSATGTITLLMGLK